MAPESKPGQGKGGGFEIRWEWPQEHIAGVLSAVGDAAQKGQRAWGGFLQGGICSPKWRGVQFPGAWGKKGRGATQGEEEQVEPVRAAVVPTSVVTVQDARGGNGAGAAENGSHEMESLFRFSEEFRMPELNSGGAVTKEDLGRATWTFLHTLAAQYPEKPTRQQQRDVKELMSVMTRLYPCKTCAEHFKEVVKVYPVKADSGVELAQWMCQVHNVVNRSLGKPQFPCQRVDARWGELHCDEGACDLEGRLLYK